MLKTQSQFGTNRNEVYRVDYVDNKYLINYSNKV